MLKREDVLTTHPLFRMVDCTYQLTSCFGPARAHIAAQPFVSLANIIINIELSKYFMIYFDIYKKT
jgi:hypothetical protein